jgi:SNF2 family DNA or RNA helicase
MYSYSTTGILETQFEPGDRIEVALDDDSRGLVLPAEFRAREESIESLEDPEGRPIEFRSHSVAGKLVVPDLAAVLPENWDCLWLEYRDQGRFRLVVEKAPRPPAEAEEFQTEQGVPILSDPSDWSLVRRANLGGSGLSSATLPEVELALRAARLSTHGGFDQLICLPLVRDMELLEHQVRTAKTVLRRFRGRALLCDEVGLGKTIEAGLVLDELVLRGLVRSVLVLTPPSLVEQWQGEMRRKFSLDFTAYDGPAFRETGPEAWSNFDRVIASIHTAKREPHRSAIVGRKWDMIVVDEAHHLRNRNTQAWRFASELQKQYILLLTATPVQNNLDELFNLVTLLEPGLLSTARKFQSRFVDRRDKLTPKNVDELHGLLSEVMVRNQRATVGLQFTRRWARTETLALLPGERELYDDVTGLVREQLRGADAPLRSPGVSRGPERTGDREAGGAGVGRTGLNRMVLLTLQMALGSSSRAASATLRRLAEQPRLAAGVRDRLAGLAEQGARQADSSKVRRLLGILDEFGDKMVIFTQFRATQDMLAEKLRDAGHDLALFHGGLTRMEKEAAVERFRGPARLLLATESGSEGRNLQFAHAICNFDLSWNPMKIEQRIGRLSRIGQTRDVYVFNLVAAGTVEAAVLHLLEAKLSMFELVIGEIDMILGNLEDEREFEDVVADLLAESQSPDDFAVRMEDLGSRLLAAKEAYLKQRMHDERLFGSRFSPER